MRMFHLLVIACGLLLGSIALAEGGKNQGDEGKGEPTPVRDPMPFEWPGIDW